MNPTVVKVAYPALEEGNIEINNNTIRSMELLQGKHSEKEFYDVQKSVRSVKELNLISEHRNTRAIELVWSNITVRTLDGQKTLLEGATGKIKSRFLAIMGPSGSGKTTLMNTLACRMSNATMEGEQRIEGMNYTNSELKYMAGYVMQDDLLNANLTVYETLHYCAELRLPSDMPAADKKARIEDAMAKLGITGCRDVIIGDSMKKGISGGERKRVCVAMELLTKPRLLFLDEPTSGLDSVTAYSLTKTLAELSASGDCTVICTLHQPQSKIFEMFDDLLLLKAGRVVFYGPAKECIKFYADAGFPVPPMTNPADHFLDVITPSHHEAEKDDNALVGLFRPEKFDFKSDEEKRLEGYSNLIIHKRTSWWHQFLVLLERTWLDATRSYSVIFTLLVQNIVISLLIGGVFWQIGTDQESAVRRSPALFFTVINQGVFAAMSVINSFPSERRLVLRERAAGTYHVSAYFLAKNLVDAAIQILGPIVFSVIVYFMIGFQPGADKFFIFMGFMILASFTSTSLALAISTFARTTTMSVTILPFVFELCRLYGGFFLSPSRLPKYFVWLDALSYVKYVYVGISLNEMQGLQLSCTLPDQSRCVTGANRIADLGLDYISIGGCAAILVAMIIFFRYLSYLGVRYVKW
jgi:ATP-binding cassette subfamily G (WHITE) protein 2